MSWSRNTPWKQGSFLNSRNFSCLDASRGPGTCDVAIAISHDCDIANDNLNDEPYVEFLLAEQVSKEDGNYMYAKNPRTLHIEARHKDVPVALEIKTASKQIVSKYNLSDISPDLKWTLNGASIQNLKFWLGLRYTRHALPNSLVNRLNSVLSFIQRESKGESRYIIGYWLDVTPLNEELPPGKPYEVEIYLVYIADVAEARRVAERLCSKIAKEIGSLSPTNISQNAVIVPVCKALSERDFTFEDARKLIHYNFEHISLNPRTAGPSGEIE